MEDPIQNPDEVTCPYTAHKKLCKDKRAHCPKWIYMPRVDRRTGEKIDEWMCADTWVPILLAEVIHNLDGVQKATESFRNEMVARADGVPALGNMRKING